MIVRFNVVTGCVAVADERLVQVLGFGSDGLVEIRDLANGEIRYIGASELRAAPLPQSSSNQQDAIANASEHDWEIARRREAAVQRILASANIAEQVVRAANEIGVSRRTVFRWIATFREQPRTSALLPKPMGPPTGSVRLDDRVSKLIDEVIRDVYLTKVRAKKEEVVRMVALRCTELGLKAPSRKPVLARLSMLDQGVVARARLQASEAASLVDYVPGTYKVQRPLEVIQIDHTLADIIVVDEQYRLPIGRPWLTLAIDVATRVIVGFYVSLEAPSSTSVALCLSMAVLPKEQWLKHRGLECIWPIWGLPKAVHADNGADFTAAALRRGCDEHGMKIILRPIAKPHYGGHIERLIGTLMGRVHLLPGTTGSNPQDRGDYPSESEARLTMAELEQWLALEICEQYHRREHKGLGRSPLSAWQQAMSNDNFVRSLPEQPDQFTVSFLPFEQRKLRRDGIHMFHIRYWDNVLPALVKPGNPFLVRYDPRNLSKVWVTGPDQRYHAIPYADLSLPPITLWEHRAALTSLKAQGNSSVDQPAIFQAVLKQRALIEKASAKTKSARRLSQRQKDAGAATGTRNRVSESAIDYSQPVVPYDAEIWD
jgi:putative transposase